MATAKTRTGRSGRLAASWPRLLLLAALILAALGWYYGPDLSAKAGIGTAYGARVACSCRHAGGRSLADCEKDFEPGMELVSLSEDEKAKSVTASVPLLASHTATWREGYGCVLEKWER